MMIEMLFRYNNKGNSMQDHEEESIQVEGT